MTDTTQGAANMLRAKAANRGRKNNGRGKRSPFSARRVAVFLLLLLIGLTGSLGYIAGATADKIVPGVTINSFDVSDMTPDEARRSLAAKLAEAHLFFAAEDVRQAVLITSPARPNGKQIASFDIDAAVKKAFEVGHEEDGLVAAAERIDAYVFGASIKLPTTLDLAELRAVVMDKFGRLVGPAKNASLSIRLDGGAAQVSVLPAQEGTNIDFERLAKDAAERLKTFSPSPIAIRIIKDSPELVTADIQPLVEKAKGSLKRFPLAVKAKDLAWSVSAQQVSDWLEAVPAKTSGKDKAELALNAEKVRKYLESRTAQLRIEPIDAVFEMKDGKVTNFKPSVDGEAVDVDVSLSLLDSVVLKGDGAAETAPLEMPFRAIPPETDTAASNPYGIKEVIGVGESNFKGSPKNRRSNIATGAKSLNGIIIPADMEFSLLKALGTIDEAHGYLKELVIKENKTTPEFGGGLCQIGTTTFRSVLSAGLPVIERRNHSYRVVYYERDGGGKPMGPGKDATIYDPWPDFKFINDTGHALLLLTAINGDRLTFTLWGTKDGRKAEQTDAKVSNIVPPPEKKTIETTELKPGETKCTESPHAGADAVFTYTVTYADGTVKKKDFYSHYKPWGEVCLIGVDPNAQPAAGTPALPSADVVGATGN
jgi:vancomycin resistance protein YoaR